MLGVQTGPRSIPRRNHRVPGLRLQASLPEASVFQLQGDGQPYLSTGVGGGRQPRGVTVLEDGLPENLAWGAEGGEGRIQCGPGPPGSTGFSRPVSLSKGDTVPPHQCSAAGCPLHTGRLHLPSCCPRAPSLPPPRRITGLLLTRGH